MANKIVLFILIMVSGCTIRPYNLNDANIQPVVSWRNENSTIENDTNYASLSRNQIIQTNWWLAFNDPELSKLIDLALKRSPNIYDAILRLKSANLNYKTQRLTLTPDFSSGLSSGVSKSLKPDSKSNESYSFGISTSYELDLWQKISDTTSTKRLQREASEWDLKTAQLVVSINVAKLYWQIINTQNKIQFAKTYLAKTQKIHSISEALYNTGKARKYDLLVSKLTVSYAEKQLIDNQYELNLLTRQLNLALDYPPEMQGITLPTQANYNIPAIPAGMPADIIKNRPDIAAAELRLRANNKELSALVKSFYPPISLSSSVGSSSTALHDLLSKSITGSLGLSIGLPFIQWNRVLYAIESGNLQYDQGLTSFRTTLYNAYQEVETALAQNAQLALTEDIVLQEIQAASQLEAINKIRFVEGVSPIKEWIQASVQHETKKLQHLDIKTQKLIAATALIQAVGGLYSRPKAGK